MQQAPRDILRTRMEGLRRSLELTDRVLSGLDVTLKIDLDCPPESEPAASMGKEIKINAGTIKNLGSNAALVSILGLNYHEVGHVRYGVNPHLLQNAVSYPHGRFMEAFGVIEEARVETLLSTKYERMKKYFTYPVVEFFVNDQSTWGTAFLFTHGRRYLPKKIRDTFRNMFEEREGKETTQKYADLIDAYRTLSFRKEPGRREGARLIEEFARLLDQNHMPRLAPHDSHRMKVQSLLPSEETDEESEEASRQTKQQDEKEAKSSDSSDSKKGQDSDEELEEDLEEENKGEDGEEEEDEDGTADLADDDEDEDEGPDDTGETSPEDESGEEGEPDGSGDGEDNEEDPFSDDGERGDGDSEGSDDSDAESDEGEGSEGDDPDGLPGDGDSSATDGVGSGNRSSDAEKPYVLEEDELAEVLEDMLDAVLDSSEVQEDIDNFRGAMESEDSLSSLLGRHPQSSLENLQPVTPEMIRESALLGDVLRQLWAQMEPGWLYGLSEGSRIDMNRAAMAREPDDYDSIYVDWEEGQQDNSGVEVVIVADESSSMSGYVGAGTDRNQPTRGSVLSKSVWELMFALQEIEASVTVLTFSSASRTLYDRDDRVSTNGHAVIRPSGGTNPAPAVVEARRILTMSEMPNKMLIAISDGEWGFNLEIRDSLDAVEEAVKVAILIGQEDEHYRFQYSEKFHVVARTTGSVFEPMAEAVVKLTERNTQR